MKLLNLLLLTFLSLNALAKPISDNEEKIFECYFHSYYLPNSFAKVVMLKSNNSCQLRNDKKSPMSHLRTSGIEGLIIEKSISCYRVTSKNIKNGLTNNSEMVFETIKQLESSPPESYEERERVNRYPLKRDYIEKIGWFSDGNTPECTYVYVIDSESVGHSAGFSRQQINYNMILLIVALSSLTSLLL